MVSVSVDPAPPQATISSPTKPTASPVTNRPLPPAPRHDGDGRTAAGLQPGSALGDLFAHVGNVQLRNLPRVREERHRRLRLVGVDVDLERGLVADDEHRVAKLLEPGHEGAG